MIDSPSPHIKHFFLYVMFATCPGKPHQPWSDLVIISAKEYKLCGSLSGSVLVFLVSVNPRMVNNYSGSEGWLQRVVKFMSIMQRVCYGKLILI